MILILLSACVIFSHGYLIVWIIRHWQASVPKEAVQVEIDVSVIIPNRNDFAVLVPNVIALSAMIPNNWEIMVIDDFSNEIEKEKAQNQFAGLENVVMLDAIDQGKKSAIETGIKASRKTWILTLDADTSFNKDGIISLSKYMMVDKTKMIIPPLKMKSDGSPFQEIQQFEFLSLMTATHAFASSGYPIMCNGAFLAFRKSAFEEVNGYEGNKQKLSGDDVYLMFKILKHSPNSVVNLTEKDAIAEVYGTNDLGDFFNQRVRWAGKSSTYQNPTALVISWFILITNLWFFVLLFGWMAGYISAKILVIYFLIKWMLDYVSLIKPSKFFDIKNSFFKSLSLAIIYPFYVTIIGVSSFFYTPNWKGRKIS